MKTKLLSDVRSLAPEIKKTYILRLEGYPPSTMPENLAVQELLYFFDCDSLTPSTTQIILEADIKVLSYFDKITLGPHDILKVYYEASDGKKKPVEIYDTFKKQEGINIEYYLGGYKKYFKQLSTAAELCGRKSILKVINADLAPKDGVKELHTEYFSHYDQKRPFNQTIYIDTPELFRSFIADRKKTVPDKARAVIEADIKTLSSIKSIALGAYDILMFYYINEDDKKITIDVYDGYNPIKGKGVEYCLQNYFQSLVKEYYPVPETLSSKLASGEKIIITTEKTDSFSRCIISEKIKAFGNSHISGSSESSDSTEEYEEIASCGSRDSSGSRAISFCYPSQEVLEVVGTGDNIFGC